MLFGKLFADNFQIFFSYTNAQLQTNYLLWPGYLNVFRQ